MPPFALREHQAFFRVYDFNAWWRLAFSLCQLRHIGPPA